MKLRGKEGEKGFVFATVVAFSALLFGITLSYVDLLVSESKLVRSSLNSQKAEALAEAGMEEAFWEYNYGGADFTSGDGWASSGTTRTRTVTGFTDTSGAVVGNYTTTITNYSGTNPTIVTTGTLTGQGGAALSATLRAQLKPRPEFTNAITASGTVHLDSNANVNSFNSTTGNYGGANIASNGDVVTSSTAAPAITLDSNATIYGDAGAGAASGGMTSGDIAQITGTYTGGSTVTMPNNDTKYASTITTMQAMPDLGTLSGSPTISSSGRYRRISTNSNSVITINGNVTLYLWETATAIDLDSNTDIIINPGCSLTIISAGEVHMDSNCDVNLSLGSRYVSRFSLIALSTCTSVDLDSNVNISGVISAPSADFQLDSNVDIYGALVGDQFDLDSNVGVHYDENLGTSGSGTGTKLRWMRRTA